MRFLMLILAGLTCAGCASSPIPSSIRKQAAGGPTLKDVQQKPDTYAGKKVLWGGKIIEVRNLQEGATMQILQTPLNSLGEPQEIEKSEGRFLVNWHQYLDKEIFRVGRFVTVWGTLTGSSRITLDKEEPPRNLPVVAVDDLYLWPPRYDYSTGASYPPYYYDPYDPYWNYGGAAWGPRWHGRFGLGWGN
jgi:outer membrane lipoprotein